jgi:Secretion system C-terminal sorting domain
MKKGLLSLIITIVAININAQPANINISQTSVFEGEPYLAINPTNPNNIVVAWMADDASTNFKVSIKTKTSFDGGLTWGNPDVKPHLGTTWSSADVSMQFRNNGTLYLSYIDSHQSPDSGGVYCTHSLNGGITWSAPTQIWNGITEDPTKRPLDRPWLAADNSGTSTDGMFYITTKPAPWISPPNRAYLKTSADSGQTWSAYRYVDTTNYLIGNLIAAPMTALTVAPDGALCIAYPSYVSTQSVYPKFFFGKSYSRGASFQYHDLVVNPVGLAVADSSYKQGYNLAANPMNANQLAFAGLQSVNGDPDVYVATTNDGGTTWSNLIRVNDDAIGNGVGQDLVWASYDRNNNLVVVWRDRRNGVGSGYAQNTDTYCAVSHNNGATWQPNVRISSVSAAYAAILLQKGNDFMSCQLLNDTIYAAWGDVRTGTLNIFFAKVSVSTGSASGIVSINAEDEEGISVYPNPAKQQFFIVPKNKEMKQITLYIYDEKGTLVVQQNIENTTEQSAIDIPNLSAGIYFIRAIADGKKIYNEKMVVEK